MWPPFPTKFPILSPIESKTELEKKPEVRKQYPDSSYAGFRKLSTRNFRSSVLL